jgi:RNA polymerase sigma-70 factor (ECF subfamily)
MVGVRTGRKSARRELEALYERRFADFTRVASVIVGGEAQAIDVVQETFARALSSIDSYTAQGPLEAWVWRILINAARSQVRRREPPLADVAEIEAMNGHVDDASRVRAWVAALPERQRLVVFLRYYADLDYRSIAAALEVEVGTVSATLSAAHTALRRMVKEVPR